MTNKEIKSLFEENLRNQAWHFKDWSNLQICSKKEHKTFVNWLNQLNEEEICDYLKLDPTILSVINNQINKICEFSIKQEPWCLMFVKNQTKELCKLAIEKWSGSIQFVEEQTVEICLLALKLDKGCYKYVRIVPNPNYKTTIKNLLNKKEILEAFK